MNSVCQFGPWVLGSTEYSIPFLSCMGGGWAFTADYVDYKNLDFSHTVIDLSDYTQLSLHEVLPCFVEGRLLAMYTTPLLKLNMQVTFDP